MTAIDYAYRNAEIVRDYDEGHTMAAVAAHWGITKQRVSQIVKAARRAEIKARCASGEHGETEEQRYEVWVGTADDIPWSLGNGEIVVRQRTVCLDCGEVIEP